VQDKGKRKITRNPELEKNYTMKADLIMKKEALEAEEKRE